MYSNNNDSALTGFLAGRADSNSCCNNGNGNGNGMWGDNWAWILIVLFALWGNWGNGNGWGGNNGGNGGGGVQYLPYAVSSSYTDSAIQRGFDNSAVINKLDGITQGLCDGFYSMNTGILNGFNSIGNAICDAQYATQQGFNATQVAMMQGNNALQSQLAQCLTKIFYKAKKIFSYNFAVGTCAA